MSRRIARVALCLIMLASMLPVPTALADEPSPGTPHPRNADPQAAGGDGVAALSSFSGAVIDNGLFQLGINPEGDMNLPNAGQPSAGTGTTTVGLRYEPENTEVLAPGCLCEGWGVGDQTSGVSGWANRDYGGPSANLTAVRDSDAILHRLSYSIVLLGRIVTGDVVIL